MSDQRCYHNAKIVCSLHCRSPAEKERAIWAGKQRGNIISVQSLIEPQAPHLIKMDHGKKTTLQYQDFGSLLDCNLFQPLEHLGKHALILSSKLKREIQHGGRMTTSRDRTPLALATHSSRTLSRVAHLPVVDKRTVHTLSEALTHDLIQFKVEDVPLLFVILRDQRLQSAS